MIRQRLRCVSDRAGFVEPARTKRFEAQHEFYRNRKCPMRHYTHRNGPECTVGRGRYFGPANKTCLRDCPRCKSAKYSLPRVGDWRQPTAPPCTARVLAPSSRSVNFRFFGKRRAQLNERDARI